MCVFRLSLLLSLWSQYSHWNSLLSLWTVFTCRRSLPLWDRILWHFSHFTFNVSLYAALSSSDIRQNFSCFKILSAFLSFPQVAQVTKIFGTLAYNLSLWVGGWVTADTGSAAVTAAVIVSGRQTDIIHRPKQNIFPLQPWLESKQTHLQL